MSFTITTTPKQGTVVNEDQCFTVDINWTNDVTSATNPLVDGTVTATIVNGGGATGRFYGSADTSASGLTKTVVCPVAGGVAHGGCWDFQLDVAVGAGIGTVTVGVTVDGWDGWHYMPVMGLLFENPTTATDATSSVTTISAE